MFIYTEPGTPSISKLEPTSNNSITVYWNLLSEIESNGVVDEYKIVVMQGKVEEKSIPLELDNINKQQGSASFLVGDLGIYKEYSFKIAAHNDKGYGEYSEPKSARTQEGSKAFFSVSYIFCLLWLYEFVL